MQYLAKALLTLPIIFVLTACAGTYDEESDKGITALQQRIDRQIVALITYAQRDGGQRTRAASATAAPPAPGWVSGPSYAESETHYGDVDSAFQSLILRFQIMSSAGIEGQREALERARGISQSMQGSHRSNGTLQVPELVTTRNLFLAAFSPLLSFQRVIRPSK